MSVPRIDRLTTPPIVGRFYLVPTVRTAWCGKLADWPVIGPKHDDREFFAFSEPHYHLDARFLRPGHPGIHKTLNYPVHWPRGLDGVMPKPVWRRRKCQRTTNDFNPHHATITAMCVAFAGRQCALGPGGWICPHRKAALGSVVPVDGIIICPLHGLKIDAATGVCLTTEAR